MADGRAPAPRSFDEDRALLLETFTDVVRMTDGVDVLELHERIVGLARRARDGDEDATAALTDLVARLELDEAELLVRTLTRWFQLINLAEDNERLRRLAAREAAGAPAPRRGSIADAVGRLADRGATAEELGAMLRDVEIRLVLTAHPTEARRRTTIEKQARIFDVLRELEERPRMTVADARERLLPTVQALWSSDELRAVSLTALDEARGSLIWFLTTLAAAVPAIYRDLEAALAERFGDGAIEVPPLLSFGTWIGGDRDGNPNVTPAVTAEALELMRSQCIRFLEGRVELLAGRVSLSERVVGRIEDLEPILSHGERCFPPLAAQLRDLNPEEPYRRAFAFIRERLRATRRAREGGYAAPAELLDDLRAVEASLRAHGNGFVAGGELRDVIRQAEVFGFHFARMDVREHAKRHRAALAEVFSELGVAHGYADRSPQERADLLCRAIADRRPLIPADIGGFGEETREVIETFRAIRSLLDGGHRDALQAYVISGTETAADLLEVLLLMKEASLAAAGGERAVLRIVPLFEAGATLHAAADTMDELLRRPEYRRALEAVGDEQEVMIGYSDSNKDAGYVASGWATYQAQDRIAAVLAEHGATWIFFHGRGGAVGRGGGPTSVAIAALPPGTVRGRLKMTEQGEVLATKYAVSPVAHRELELTTSAAVFSSSGAARAPAPDRLEHYRTVLEAMAERSTRAYRALVYEDPDFAAFFTAVTPIEEISRLRLGSRPAKRKAGGGIEDLRAIPWVFSWTQSRIILPAWFGLGTALAAARDDAGLELLREMEREWPFFAGLLSNAEMACAKADMHIARAYVELWDNEAPRERIWAAIVEEFDRTRRELLGILGAERLLDRSPVLQASIDRRNPYVDPLSVLQVELLRRIRSAEDEPGERLGRLSLLTINGIAGGLRNTG
ncbi:MAG TPA: phosphoenolpyruvate carboxylase [Solirubrobacteraceae bacterium]